MLPAITQKTRCWVGEDSDTGPVGEPGALENFEWRDIAGADSKELDKRESRIVECALVTLFIILENIKASRCFCLARGRSIILVANLVFFSVKMPRAALAGGM